MFTTLRLQNSGKLIQQASMAVNVCKTVTSRLIITDKTSKRWFLIDTGSDLSVFPPKFIHNDLNTCPYVFLRQDVIRKALDPPYIGPYRVISRSEKSPESKFAIKLSLSPPTGLNQPISSTRQTLHSPSTYIPIPLSLPSHLQSKPPLHYHLHLHILAQPALVVTYVFLHVSPPKFPSPKGGDVALTIYATIDQYP
jgi:hypothetical protein